MENQNSRYGAIAKMLPFTPGKIFFVIEDSDSLLGNFLNEFPADRDGKVRVYSTLAAAYDATTSGNNDVIILSGNTTHDLTELLTISKNRVHIYGEDYFLGVNRSNGPSTKVQIGVTAVATDIAAVLNTGVRNSFHNIKFISNNTVAQGIYAFVDGGEYTWIENCEFYKTADYDTTAAAEFVCNADSPTYKNCTFGSLADARIGAVIRPTVLFTAGIAGAGKVARDVKFIDCHFWINASNTANRFVYGANATDIERLCLFDNCKFINNGASAAVPAQNVAFGATLTVGMVLLNQCVSLNATTAMSTTTGVFVNGPVPAADTTGIALQAS